MTNSIQPTSAPAPPSGLDLACALARQRIAANQLPLIQLVELAEPLIKAARQDELIALYRAWLAQARAPHDGQRHAALFNLGVLLGAAGHAAAAAQCYREALRIDPDFAQARINLGHQLEAAGAVNEALDSWRGAADALAPKGEPGRALRLLALNNFGRLAEQARRYPEAEAALAASLALDAQQPDVIQHWVHLRQKQCRWPVYDAQAVPGLSVNAMLLATSPLAMLAAFDDPALQMLAAHNFVSRKFADPVRPIGATRRAATGANPRRLRIGYLGGNLCVHAVGLLLADVLMHQDRERFESYAFCYSPEDGSAYRARLLAAFDHLERVADLDDARLAQLIADRQIDLLVDLHSLSDGVRPGVLMRRPAPVQLSWLGFIGPSALPCIDYLVADRFALCEAQRPFYAEAPLYLARALMPLCRRAPQPVRQRAGLGLPESGFVYASFNNVYKLNPAMFASWMRILAQTGDSALWLLDDNPAATGALRARAAAHGVDPARLVFSPRVAHADYLARFQCADLFLDNHPYNAGSTAADALGCGLPLLTLSGATFVARMAGAMLEAAGLPELITTTHDAYEQTAVRLWREPARLADLRRRLDAALRQDAACDAAAYMRDLEQLFAAAIAGKTPPRGAWPA